MKIDHHANDETLLAYASGELGPGPRIVVAAHVGSCAHCRDRLADLEAVGGSVLEAMDPAELSEFALARLEARLEQDLDAEPPVQAKPMRADLGIPLPRSLDECTIGPWRWIGPGVRYSKVRVPADPSANVMLLKVAAGRKLPEHTHSGREYTQVLVGSFSDGRGRYGPGDMDEADDDVQHQPIVDPGMECICLAALEGGMRLRGFFGRMIQPLIGG